jgi:hypothetical protein
LAANRLTIDQLLRTFAVTRSLHLNLRGGIFNFAEIIRRKLYVNRAINSAAAQRLPRSRGKPLKAAGVNLNNVASTKIPVKPFYLPNCNSHKP